jgi:hypothetical protein
MTTRKMLLSDLEMCSKILEKEYSKDPYFESFQKESSLKYLESKFLKNQETSFVIEENKKIV